MRCAAVSLLLLLLLLLVALLVCTVCKSGSDNGVTEMDDTAARQSPHGDCPTGTGFRPLTGLHPPEKIIITTLPKFVDNEAIGPYHVKAAKQLADAVGASGTGAKLVIAGIDPNHVPERMHVLQEPPYDDIVEFMLESTGGRPWIQDDFQLGVVGDPPEAALVPMLNNSQWLGEGLGLPVLEDLRLRLPGNRRRHEAGGNVEAYPGGLISIGTRSRDERGPTELGQRLLDDGAEEIVRPYTGWLGVGHTDEMFNVVPTGSGPCDIAVVYASPGLGMQLAEKAEAIESLGPWDEGEQAAPTRPTKKGACLENFPRVAGHGGSFWSRVTIPAGEVLACEPFKQANQQYEKLMQEELGTFTAALQRATGCSKIEAVPLPALFTPNEEADDYTSDAQATPLHANPVNGVVLGRTYAAPSQAHPLFEAEVRKRLGDLGVPIEFVDTKSCQNGALHCVTNVLRRCVPNGP